MNQIVGVTPGSPPSAIRTVLAAFAALALAGGLCAVVVAAFSAGAWWAGWRAAFASVLLATLLSTPLLWIGFSRGGRVLVAMAVVAMGLRLGVALAAALIAVHALGYPEAPTLLMMVGMYVAVLAAESIGLALAAWNLRL